MEILRLVFFAICVSLLSSCSGPKEQTQDVRWVDDQMTSSLKIVTDAIKDGEVGDRQVGIVSWQNSDGLTPQQLVDTLFAFAVSGAAEVYAPDFVSQPNWNHRLDGTELLSLLNSVDTVFVDDLETGLQVQRVVEQSFDARTVSFISLHFIPGEETEMVVDHCAIGVQVFDQITGGFRGYSPKLFIGFSQLEHTTEGVDIYYQSDSLGLMQLHHFSSYENSESNDAFLSAIEGGEYEYTLLFDPQSSTMQLAVQPLMQ